MATNPNVEVDRLSFIGGSEIPTMMNLSPFQKRWDLLRIKAGLMVSEFNGNEYTEYGNIMECKIRDFINLGREKKFIEGTFYKDHPVLNIRCNVDGEIDDTILEIKTTSVVHDNVDEYLNYLVQLLFYMMNSNRPNGILAVYERPKDFNEELDPFRLQVFNIRLEDYKNLCERINNAVDVFCDDLEKLKENPFLTEFELTPKSVATIGLELVEIENKLVALKELEKKEKELKEQLYKAMVESDVKSWSTMNGVKITRVDAIETKKVVEKQFNLDKFKEENQELYQKYVDDKEIEKKGRSGYVKITL